MEALIGSGFILVIIIAAVMIFLHFVPLGLWISAMAANVSVGIFTLVGMRMRRVPPVKIVMPLIKANKAGLDVNVNQLEAHYLAGGNVDKVVDALIAAHRAQIPLPFERSAAIDLAARDVLEAIQMSVNPFLTFSIFETVCSSENDTPYFSASHRKAESTAAAC